MPREGMEEYLEQCRKLSLTARMAIALLIFERFCEDNNILSPLVSELSSYLWKWPIINGPDEFYPWESSRPELANYALGDEASSDLLASLELANIDENRFRSVVSGVIEILWVSFWGAAENERAMESLTTTIKSSKLPNFPPLTPFKFCVFSDGSGWGEKITKEDCHYWRECFKNA